MIEEGFVEREIHAETDRCGDIAHVFSTHETIHTAKGSEPVDRGINSFQLWYDGDRWWIMSLLYHEEREGAPLPERYTKLVAEKRQCGEACHGAVRRGRPDGHGQAPYQPRALEQARAAGAVIVTSSARI